MMLKMVKRRKQKSLTEFVFPVGLFKGQALIFVRLDKELFYPLKLKVI